MIVPEYWAEARQRCRRAGRQVTVRRWGWSDESQVAAQAMAESRAALAIAQIAAGQLVLKRERKMPYNGAQGVPIREEILGRNGDAVMTRNSYGARCLNTPDVLFADVDFDVPDSRNRWVTLVVIGVIAAAIAFSGWEPGWGGIATLLVAVVGAGGLMPMAWKTWIQSAPALEKVAIAKIERFLVGHPDWALRVYRTPAGLRLMATHRLFNPSEADVKDFFSKVGADPLFVRMCINQNCFRARLTAKPWRIGLHGSIKPRPGVWPISQDRLKDRLAWIDFYEKRAAHYSACRFLFSTGSGSVDPRVAEIIALHDAETRALLPGLAMA